MEMEHWRSCGWSGIGNPELCIMAIGAPPPPAPRTAKWPMLQRDMCLQHWMYLNGARWASSLGPYPPNLQGLGAKQRCHMSPSVLKSRLNCSF